MSFSGRFGEHLNSTVMVDSEYRGWIDVNVTNTVSEWTRSWSAENHGLFLKVSSAAQPGNRRSIVIIIILVIIITIIVCTV